MAYDELFDHACHYFYFHSTMLDKHQVMRNNAWYEALKKSSNRLEERAKKKFQKLKNFKANVTTPRQILQMWAWVGILLEGSIITLKKKFVTGQAIR